MEDEAKAAAAFDLLQLALENRNRSCVDLMASLIEENDWYHYFEDDAGNKIMTMAHFLAEVEKDATGGNPIDDVRGYVMPTASRADVLTSIEEDFARNSSGFHLMASVETPGGGRRRLTPEERYAQRQAANRAAGR